MCEGEDCPLGETSFAFQKCYFLYNAVKISNIPLCVMSIFIDKEPTGGTLFYYGSIEFTTPDLNLNREVVCRISTNTKLFTTVFCTQAI